MADFRYGISLGRIGEYINRVNSNDPANSAFVIVAINTSEPDANLRDLDTLALILSNGNTDEANNTNYARKVLTDADNLAITVDDANDRVDFDADDLTWTDVAGDGTPNAWTDLLFCYDSDTTGGDDTNIVPISQHDFPITPDGSSIVATVNTAGFARSTAA